MDKTVLSPSASARAERGVSVGRLVGITALVIFIVGAIAALAALMLSVQVYGDSMEPTLKPGDRLSTNFFGRDHVRRFDLVETTSDTGTLVVKRIIGMPGDSVRILMEEGLPIVQLKRSGEDGVNVVENKAWINQISKGVDSCCEGDGRSADDPHWSTIPEDSYWVIGDNWGASTDSRSFGFVTQESIRATLNMRVLPLSRFGSIPSPGTSLIRQD